MKQYDLYRARKTVSLNGQWRFCTDPDRVGVQQRWQEAVPGNAVSTVPLAWNVADPKLSQYEGCAWYQRDFYCAEGDYLLQFNGVADAAEVYLDGRLLGSHYGAYTPFSFSLKSLASGQHRLTVMVDNAKNTVDTLPLPTGDWFICGGIIREVELYPLPGFFVRRMQLAYTLQGNDAQLNISAFCDGEGTADYRLLMDGKEMLTVTLQAGGNTVSVSVPGIERWSPEHPKLYYFTLCSDNDSITERTGFRTVTVENGKILLNGAAIQIKGVNRHDAHPDWGLAMPDSLEKRDLDLVIKLGCNMIRGAHYPHREYMLELCDEYGILYWSEIPLWQYQRENFSSERLTERSKTMLREMIETQYNHPSVIVWGLHNECATETEEGVAFTAELQKTVRTLDPTRLISYATDRPLTDLCYEYCDVISINKYYGWYEGGFDAWDVFFEELRMRLRTLGQENKPIIMSEFGAGGIYGCHNFDELKWSEEYQSRCIAEAFKRFDAQEQVVGTFVWQLTDQRSIPGKMLSRPRGYNNKGLLDEYRRPKLAFETVRRQYCGEKQ